jgi:hypothetical protein
MNKQTIANVLNWARAHTTAVALIFLGTASLALYLVTQHTAHVVGALPYALILLCPLMHFLMPGMHGSHGSHAGHGDRASQSGDLHNLEPTANPASQGGVLDASLSSQPHQRVE